VGSFNTLAKFVQRGEMIISALFGMLVQVSKSNQQLITQRKYTILILPKLETCWLLVLLTQLPKYTEPTPQPYYIPYRVI
jgi:hypothetical protein